MKFPRYCLRSVLVFAGLTLLLRAQDGKKEWEQKEKESVYAELEKVPERDRQKTNPLGRDPDSVAAGEVLFEEHCEECHGSRGVGGKKAPSLRAPEVQNATPGAIFWILTNGVVRKKMPVWSKLPEPQRWQLVSYVKSLGTVEPAGSEGQLKP
jgi:mono/diheme cytochrome c family protein